MIETKAAQARPENEARKRRNAAMGSPTGWSGPSEPYCDEPRNIGVGNPATGIPD
jgi:hypothetical protein